MATGDDEWTGRELFGPRQGELIDAVSTRICNGPPLSDPDMTVTLWLASVLLRGAHVAAWPGGPPTHLVNSPVKLREPPRKASV